MRVCVSSAAPFHTFDLARQLERLGHLDRLYTAYPRWRVKGIAREKVGSFPWLMLPAIVANRWGLEWINRRLSMPVMETYDRWVASNLERCDIFHSLSGFGTFSHRKARERFGTVTVCDRGSSHIEEQDRLVTEENERFGIAATRIDRRVVERELEEYANCDLIVVPSSFARQTFIQRGVPESKLRQNPYGVDLSMFKPERKPDDKFRILFVGSISIRKGVGYLLEACAHRELADAEVWLIGAIDPAIRPVLVKYEGAFRHLGVVPRSELYHYYSQASVFVLPSIEEGLALVQAQALACGIPVIASTNTGAEDLFDDGVEGFIVPIRNPQAIRDRLIQLRDNPALREKMAHAALERVRSIGGWDAYGNRAEEIYRQALEGRRCFI